MPTIYELKEALITDTPLVLFDCELVDGTVERWSTHSLIWEGQQYTPRVVKYGTFELAVPGEDDSSGSGRLTLLLANTDSYVSQVEGSTGFKGAKLTARFVFFDLESGAATSPATVLFQGEGNKATELTEGTARLVFQSRLSFHRTFLPTMRVQRRCAWIFPSNQAQRAEAVEGGTRGRYSPFYGCGYSADQLGGRGNLNGAEPFATCNYSRQDCELRGMYSRDSAGRLTGRFSGMELAPGINLADVQVFSEEKNAAEYVPLIYGTCWTQPVIVFARNEAECTHLGALIAAGPISEVIKVMANRVELPRYEEGKDLSASGWYRLVSRGERNGSAGGSYSDSTGSPIDGPYGGIAYLEARVPRSSHAGTQIPRIEALVQGLILPRYDVSGNALSESFTANPAWVLLDLLRRAGWSPGEMDVASFARCAQYCEETVSAKDLQGGDVFVPRFRCNLVIRRRQSLAELVRGLKYSCGIYLRYGADGRLEACVEGPLSLQQPTKPWTSNSINPLGSGWPAYEFGDGTNGASGIVRLTSGAASIRLWSRTTADVPNRIRLEFDDEFNFYQRDSIVLSDADDLARGCGEVTWNLPALGVTNFAHAQRALQVQLRKSVRGNLYVEFDTSVKGVGLRPGDLITITYLKEGLNRKLFRVIRIIADLNMRTIHVVAQVHEDGWYEVSGSMVGGATVQPAFGNGAPRPLVGVTMNGDGETEFEVTEGATTLSDGSGMVTLSVRYHPPVRPTARSRRAPWLSLSPEIHSSGGTLSGGRILYYAISAVNQEGEEGPLSLVVSAPLGAGNSYRVVLLGISLPPDATAFHVYRGSIPQRLFRIASSVSPHDQFTDPGLSAMATGPADEHFDHANFYWRTELHPPVAVTAATRWTVSGSGMNWSTNQYRGKRVRIVSGAGAGQERTIESSNTNTLIVSSEWSILPNTSSQFVIAESNWHFGSRTQGRVAEFEVPNRGGSTVHITGRSANGAGIETEPGLAPVTRWTLGGTGGRGGDLGVPGAPLFGLSWKGKGTLELVGVSFESLTNTQSVESGTLTLFYYDELQGPPATTLAAAVSPAATTLQLSHPGGAVAGSSVQVGEEVMRVEAVTDGGWEYEVSRGQHTTTASAHAAGARVYHLNRKVFVIPFPRMFFGTPASGMFAHPIYLPMVRVASAELFVTNQVGSSPTRAIKLTGSTDYGLRTLSGGQFTIQVDGYLAIKDAIAPPLIVEDARVVRDILAVVQQAPLGAPIQLRLRKNGAVYANLTIPAGATSSNIVSGLELSPLESGSVLTLDIVSVGQTPETTPGRDLTVTIRL